MPESLVLKAEMSCMSLYRFLITAAANIITSSRMLGHCELLVVQIVPSHLFIISEETGSSLLQREKRNLKVYSCRICEARSRVSTKDERTEVEESVRELSGKPVMRVWSFIFQSEKIIKGEGIIERVLLPTFLAETTP